jgi:hypothetical protein
MNWVRPFTAASDVGAEGPMGYDNLHEIIYLPAECLPYTLLSESICISSIDGPEVNLLLKLVWKVAISEIAIIIPYWRLLAK